MPILLAFGGGIFAGLWARSEVDSGPSIVAMAMVGAAGYAAFKLMRG